MKLLTLITLLLSLPCLAAPKDDQWCAADLEVVSPEQASPLPQMPENLDDPSAVVAWSFALHQTIGENAGRIAQRVLEVGGKETKLRALRSELDTNDPRHRGVLKLFDDFQELTDRVRVKANPTAGDVVRESNGIVKRLVRRATRHPQLGRMIPTAVRGYANLYTIDMPQLELLKTEIDKRIQDVQERARDAQDEIGEILREVELITKTIAEYERSREDLTRTMTRLDPNVQKRVRSGAYEHLTLSIRDLESQRAGLIQEVEFRAEIIDASFIVTNHVAARATEVLPQLRLQLKTLETSMQIESLARIAPALTQIQRDSAQQTQATLIRAVQVVRASVRTPGFSPSELAALAKERRDKLHVEKGDHSEETRLKALNDEIAKFREHYTGQRALTGPMNDQAKKP